MPSVEIRWHDIRLKDLGKNRLIALLNEMIPYTKSLERTLAEYERVLKLQEQTRSKIIIP